MAPKKSGTEFEGRLSVRMSMDDLTWAARIGSMAGQDSSWAVRWAIGQARERKLVPVLKTVTDATRKGGV